jgi:predicted DNA-binding antitoxin AbrB/MazE fold protein
MTITAKFENGVFRPLQDEHLQEGAVVEVNVPSGLSPRRPASIGDTEFAGMWKDREDTAGSVGYIERLRHRLRGD